MWIVQLQNGNTVNKPEKPPDQQLFLFPKRVADLESTTALGCDLLLSSRDDRSKHSSTLLGSCWWWVGIRNVGTTTAHHHLDQAAHTDQDLKNTRKIHAGSLQRHPSRAVQSSGCEYSCLAKRTKCNIEPNYSTPMFIYYAQKFTTTITNSRPI